jgi:protein gp37
MNPRLRLDYKELVAPAVILKPARIFVCSTMELFHPRIPEAWRMEIFNIIASLSSLTFVVLTKHPENITKAMPDNVWLGVSVTCRADLWRINYLALSRCQALVPFVSFEPLFEPVAPLNEIFSGRLKWAIIGKLTGHGKKYDPARSTIEGIVEYARFNHIPLFLKNNLKDIWGGPLIQEYPK